MKPVIIFGTSSFSEVAFEYLSLSPEYNPVAFSVDVQYLDKSTHCNLPVIPIEKLISYYDPQTTYFFAALTYSKLNRDRLSALNRLISYGFKPLTYISPWLFCSPSAVIGQHCFIMENNTIQPFVSIGRNCVLWSGNHIGHHSVIGDNTFISSHCVISGHCHIGRNSFLGVNCTISNNITIGDDCWIGPGCLISKDLPPASIVKAASTPKISPVSSFKYFKIADDN